MKIERTSYAGGVPRTIEELAKKYDLTLRVSKNVDHGNGNVYFVAALSCVEWANNGMLSGVAGHGATEEEAIIAHAKNLSHKNLAIHGNTSKRKDEYTGEITYEGASVKKTDNGGEPAFPVDANPELGRWNSHPGMTLRDWFAGQAISGMLANPTASVSDPDRPHQDQLAQAAYVIADAMIEQSNKESQG